MIVDTVQGLTDVTLFTSLDDFADAPHVTVHDFDLLLHLKLLKKLGKIKDVSIIGIPQSSKIPDIKEKVNKLLCHCETVPTARQSR